MEYLKNIYLHPKTSIAGLLVAAVTVSGVLFQHGITLGHAGTGTVVELVGAIASALLGLMAKDPGNASAPSSSSTSVATKVVAFILSVLIVPVTLPMSGCTITSSQLKSDASALATALTSLSAVVSASDSSTASKLEVAAESLTALVNNWDTSTAQSTLNTIAAGVETTLANISSTSKYASLVTIAVAAIDVILANTSSSSVSARPAARPMSSVQVYNLGVYRSRSKTAITHRFGRSISGDFKAAWNKSIKDDSLSLPAIR